MKLPEGRYFIGDPCYAVKNELWSEFCDSLFNDRGSKEYEGAVILRGVEIFASNTKHGDGCYDDLQGNEYPVDAGLIGAVPLGEGITQDERNFKDLGLIIDIDREFNCSYLDEDGKITIHEYIIETDPWGDEDYEDYYDDEEDDDYY